MPPKAGIKWDEQNLEENDEERLLANAAVVLHSTGGLQRAAQKDRLRCQNDVSSVLLYLAAPSAAVYLSSVNSTACPTLTSPPCSYPYAGEPSFGGW